MSKRFTNKVVLIVVIVFLYFSPSYGTIENLSTYVEVDPGATLTVTTTKVDSTTTDTGLDVWVYKDKGVNFFNVDFIHAVEAYYGSGSGATSATTCWGMANYIDDYETIEDVYSDHALFLFSYSVGYFYLCEANAGANYYSVVDVGNDDTLYYITIQRNESIGTYGTLYAYVYSDSGRTNLLGTPTLTLHAKRDFQYIFAFNAYDNDTAPDRGTFTGYFQNLELDAELPGWSGKVLGVASPAKVMGIAPAKVLGVE